MESVRITRKERDDIRRTLLARVSSIHWQDIEDVRSIACPLLKEVANDPILLGSLVYGIASDENLLTLAESYDLLLKLVLLDFPELRCRLRLHMFLPGNFDRPHNHRWPYATHIVSGRYRHVLFRVPGEDTLAPTPRSLTPILVEEQTKGSGYALHNDAVHAVYADPFTVTLVLRGPVCTERFFVMDLAEQRTWWQYGRAQESADEIRAKRMSEKALYQTLEKLEELELIR